MSITVIGLGKIGLPLAVYFTQESDVIGLDSNHKVVEQVNLGQEPFPGEFDLQSNLMNVVKLGKLQATTDLVFSVQNSDVIVVCIPLMLNKLGAPDFSNIDRLVADIGKNMKTNTLISFETTLPVGTTRDRFTKILEAESGRIVGRDFNVVFSPERVMTGRVFQDLRRYPLCQKCANQLLGDFGSISLVQFPYFSHSFGLFHHSLKGGLPYIQHRQIQQ